MARRGRFSTSQKAVTLVPLALLSTAWTAGLVTPGTPYVPVADQVDADLPDAATLPTRTTKAPASLSKPGAVAPGVPAGRAAVAVRRATTNEIPAPALAAYQRAETVINRADAGCGLTWHMVAAIGRVESDHGRFGGNVLDSDGVAQPGIIGIPLNGKNGTARIADTDAGQLDGDRRWDRAVGPMQFIPSTWSVVGVDADGDGERNPQDIDDAALATAVYLCSAGDDLTAERGQRSAVFRYNNSDDYVDLVLSLAAAYARGDYSSMPTATAAGVDYSPQAQALPDARPATPPGRDRDRPAGARHRLDAALGSTSRDFSEPGPRSAFTGTTGTGPTGTGPDFKGGNVDKKSDKPKKPTDEPVVDDDNDLIDGDQGTEPTTPAEPTPAPGDVAGKPAGADQGKDDQADGGQGTGDGGQGTGDVTGGPSKPTKPEPTKPEPTKPQPTEPELPLAEAPVETILLDPLGLQVLAELGLTEADVTDESLPAYDENLAELREALAAR